LTIDKSCKHVYEGEFDRGRGRVSLASLAVRRKRLLPLQEEEKGESSDKQAKPMGRKTSSGGEGRDFYTRKKKGASKKGKGV